MENSLESIIDNSLNNVNEIPLFTTLFSFVICIIMSFILRDFYIRRSFSLNSKSHIGNILPILSLVIFLVIVIIKSSLALSLGLVGALSIVRFRTPIKEPEDLIYLFIAIGIGLGYGSGQILITTILSLTILFIINFWLSNKNLYKNLDYNLILNWENPNITFEDIEVTINRFTNSIKLIRIEKSNKTNTAVLIINIAKEYKINDLIKSLSKVDTSLEISFFESVNNI